MSPRAAWRLDALGFDEVYDYVPGKSDWLAADLPYEGAALLVGRVADRDVLTGRVGDRVSELSERSDDDHRPWIILNDADVVMGIVHSGDVADAEGAAVDDVMRFGTTTVRPSEDVEGLLDRMTHADVESILVTRSDGTLVGLFHADDGHRALHTHEG